MSKHHSLGVINTRGILVCVPDKLKTFFLFLFIRHSVKQILLCYCMMQRGRGRLRSQA